MIAGCYSLDLYCENYNELHADFGGHRWNEFPHQYTDEFGSKCRKHARADGWKLFKDGRAYCPKCSGRLK